MYSFSLAFYLSKIFNTYYIFTCEYILLIKHSGRWNAYGNVHDFYCYYCPVTVTTYGVGAAHVCKLVSQLKDSSSIDRECVGSAQY